MSPPTSGIVTVRLANRDSERIDELVEDGQYRSRSDFIRHAIRLALDGGSAEMGVSLGGPGSLTESGRARGGRGAKKGAKLS